MSAQCLLDTPYRVTVQRLRSIDEHLGIVKIIYDNHFLFSLVSVVAALVLGSSPERLPSFGWGLDVRTVYASLIVRGRLRGALACPCEMAVVMHPPSDGLCNLPGVAFGAMVRHILSCGRLVRGLFSLEHRFKLILFLRSLYKAGHFLFGHFFSPCVSVVASGYQTN